MFEFCLVCSVLCTLGALVLLGLSYPIRLRQVRPGDVVEFDYNQPESGERHRLLKATYVRDTKKEPILWESKRARNIERTQFLITGICDDGQYRAFYEEGISENVVKVGVWKRICLYFAGVRFRDMATVCARQLERA